MGNNKINNILIPNVSKLNKGKNVDQLDKSRKQKASDEFKKHLNEQINNVRDKIKNDHGIDLSIHAAKRFKERNIDMDSEEFYKIKNAISTLKNKGGQDSLIITDNAAYIIDVDNNKIVTAIDKDNISENVFTKIDSTIIVN